MEAAEVIARLSLQPHPEGGHFRETYRDRPVSGERGCSTAIYYLVQAGEASRWHRIDAVEVWHWYAGAPLELAIWDGAGALRHDLLGQDLGAGQRPQSVVPSFAWQSARSRGAWSLVGCTVAPAFEFAGFELAPVGWRPG